MQELAQYDMIFNKTDGINRLDPTRINKNPVLRNSEPRQKDLILLSMQSVRINAYQKQKKIASVWQHTPQQIQNFFFNYPIDERVNIHLTDILNSNKLKIIRDKNRLYFGEVFQHRKHGRGVLIYRDGRIYQGYFFENQKEGLGFEIYQNGNVFVGEFQKNKKHGHGTMYWFNFSTKQAHQYYDGQWWAGLPCGSGYHQRGNGDIYEGQFKNGLKHGEGLQSFHNGDFYIGAYINGFPEGYGEYTWNDGSSYKGDFKQGLRNGYGEWKKMTQKMKSESYKGYYLLDQRSGHGIYKWSSGNYYKGSFFQDQRHGFGQLYYNNQLIYQGMWQYGQRAEHLNNTKNVYTKADFQPRHPNIFPPVPQKYILMPMQIKHTQGDLYPIMYKFPKIADLPLKKKTKSLKKGVDMDRIYRLAQSSVTLPKGGGHKYCIPQHNWNTKKKEW